jgi:hypothetical protein
MNSKTVAFTMVVAATLLVAVPSSTSYLMTFAQSESETETEQETNQKNVCSGWALCTNDAESNINSPEEETQTVVATPT